jgi:hypothetical protein
MRRGTREGATTAARADARTSALMLPAALLPLSPEILAAVDPHALRVALAALAGAAGAASARGAETHDAIGACLFELASRPEHARLARALEELPRLA